MPRPNCTPSLATGARAPRLRLTADSTRPPRKPAIAIAAAITNDCHQENGVIHHKDAPIRIAAPPPAGTPSRLLFGLDLSGVRPIAALAITASSSDDCSTSRKYSSNIALPPSSPGICSV